VGTDAIFCSCGGPVCFLRRLFGYGTTFCMACGPNLKGNGPRRFGRRNNRRHTGSSLT
jgi:hypothetical protein